MAHLSNAMDGEQARLHELFHAEQRIGTIRAASEETHRKLSRRFVDAEDIEPAAVVSEYRDDDRVDHVHDSFTQRPRVVLGLSQASRKDLWYCGTRGCGIDLRQ